VIQLEGSLSGEHGVGLEKRDYIDQEVDAPTLELMRNIKRTFDPNNILNPGKSLPIAPTS
jgi:D-lactate dehydrogenase